MNAPQSDPSTQLRRYLGAIANRNATLAAACFTKGAILDLPSVKPNRFVGLDEIKSAHQLAFENLEHATVETEEVLRLEHSAMTAGRLTAVCRGEHQIYEFGITVETSDAGFDRVSWYFDSRGTRLWSDKSVL